VRAGLAIGCAWPLWPLWLAWLGACGGPGEAAEAGTQGTEAASTDDAPTSGPPIEDPTEGELVPLTLPMVWMPVPAETDPLAAHRPADVNCPLGGWLFEPQGLEINTLQCNYAMFGQPARAAIVKGARVVASLYHFDLVAEAPATAHVALLVGDSLVWEQEIAIPGKANAYAIDVPAPFAADPGTPVYFHLHNHGQNTWTLGAIEVEVFAK
jgi:hypothetical protein